jgi:S1-C subfamily serine protease
MVYVNGAPRGAARNPVPRGSAVVVASDGTIVTNYHVIARDNSDTLFDEIFFSLPRGEGLGTAGSPRLRVRPVLLNPSFDLALLRVVSGDGGTPAGAFSAVELADPASVKLLDDVVIIGYPKSGGESVTANLGIIEGSDALDRWLKTDARLIRGNSGGAAVNLDGKLVGIPTKVVSDRQPIDNDGDGFPDDYRELGSVGYLRPVELVGAMLLTVEQRAGAVRTDPVSPPGKSPKAGPAVVKPASAVSVTGLVQSNPTGQAVAGARVGLVPLGTTQVTPANLVAWGGSNAEGEFNLNRPVPRGRYLVKVKALGYEAFSGEVEITGDTTRIVIGLAPSR